MGQNCCGVKNFRNFLTNEEKTEMLKEYKQELEKEVAGISERIKELERNK